MSEEKQIEILSNVIKNYFNNYKKLSGEFSTYSDEYPTDYEIEFHPIKLRVTKNKGDFFDLSECTYEALLDISVDNIQVGVRAEDSWEFASHDDIPSWCFDDMLEKIEGEIKSLLPHVCLRGDLYFGD